MNSTDDIMSEITIVDKTGKPREAYELIAALNAVEVAIMPADSPACCAERLLTIHSVQLVWSANQKLH